MDEKISATCILDGPTGKYKFRCRQCKEWCMQLDKLDPGWTVIKANKTAAVKPPEVYCQKCIVEHLNGEDLKKRCSNCKQHYVFREYALMCCYCHYTGAIMLTKQGTPVFTFEKPPTKESIEPFQVTGYTGKFEAALEAMENSLVNSSNK